MYGAVQPPPVRARMSGVAAVALRVLLMVCSLGSIGLLAFVPLLRIAVLRRRWYDWALMGVSLPGAIALFALVGTQPKDAAVTNISLAALMVIAVAAAVYLLVFDIRRCRRARTGPVAPLSPAPVIPPAIPGGYGYGCPPPYAPPAPPRTYAYGQPPPMPSAPPAPPSPAHPRIEQVRAELDELSALLRKEQDGR
ncbi:hypothetical protein [Streptomyces sp. NRRL F-5126]|uniref:hypothetical protein n=1 Tax=Streptomyces sp. NRRL F-5126 TaxID=1463857 RepID=UPI0004CBABD6|nr:hypothetical protein [Streptomyces sp. NRRL F-5126]